MIDIKTLIRDNIKRLTPYSSARDEFTGAKEAMVFLDANENPFNNGLNRYPDPKQVVLKERISKIKKVKSEQLLLGNGSDEVIDLIIRAFCEPKVDNLLLLPPTYGMYKVCAEINDVETKSVKLTKEFQPDVQGILAMSDSRSKLLFLCSPNNPSGNSFSDHNIEELLRVFKGIVIIDEAYADFSEKASWIQRLEEFPNLIVLQTFSKAYGMAAIRLGVCLASPEIIAVLHSIKPPYNINDLTQQKALESLDNIQDMQDQVAQIKKNRAIFVNELETISIVKKIFPTDANFLLVKVDDANLRYKQLVDKGIVVRNRTNQLLCDNCLRLTIGTAEEIKKLIQILKELDT